MTTDTPSSVDSAPPSVGKDSQQCPSSPLPQTPTPTRGKRTIPFLGSPIPPKKRFLDNFTPGLETPSPHDLWVSVWYNGERTDKTSTIETYATLAIYKSIGYETKCNVHQINDTSSIYTDDTLWFKVTVTLPPKAVANLLEITTVDSMSAVVVFAPFPCASQAISKTELEELRNDPSPHHGTLNEIKAKPATKGGRPFTWSLRKLINLNRCTAENKKRKVQNPTKHPLQEYIELNESLNKPLDEEIA